MAWRKPWFKSLGDPNGASCPTKALICGCKDCGSSKADGVLSILTDVVGPNAKRSSAYSGGHGNGGVGRLALANITLRHIRFAVIEVCRQPQGPAGIARGRRSHNALENPFAMRPHAARGGRHGLLPDGVLRPRKTGKSQKKQVGSDSGARN